jgi:uncharacterized protein YhdP
VLFGDLVDGGRVNIEVVDNDLSFTVSEIPKPLTKEERKALKAQKAVDAEQAKEQDDITEDQTNQ